MFIIYTSILVVLYMISILFCGIRSILFVYTDWEFPAILFDFPYFTVFCFIFRTEAAVIVCVFLVFYSVFKKKERKRCIGGIIFMV